MDDARRYERQLALAEYRNRERSGFTMREKKRRYIDISSPFWSAFITTIVFMYSSFAVIAFLVFLES